MDIPLFASTQLHLLNAEHATELAEQTALITSLPPAALQRRGLALLNLTLAAQRTGLGGRTILDLAPDAGLNGADRLPAHGLRAGDIVRIAEQPAGAAKKKDKAALEARGVDGVVHRVLDSKLVVAVRADDDDAGVEALAAGGRRLWAVKTANEAVHARMAAAVAQLHTANSALAAVLLGHAAPAPPAPAAVAWLDATLNASQRRAVEFALGAPHVGESRAAAPPPPR